MLVMIGLILLTVGLCNLSAYGEELNSNEFPADFMFGASSSAFQTEGAWNENGKGENIWDRYTHKKPTHILDGSNANIACDSYHKFKEDIKIIKDLGVDFYRFSLSWSRILPKGFAYKINPDGIRYYNQLIDLLIKNYIIPMVTIFHWDTPQPIEELGGFTSSLIVDWFEEYSRIVFDHFGDRVKYWITFNEPKQMCQSGYGGSKKAPGYNSSGIADYLCAHNVLKSHARAYHLYNNTFKTLDKGLVSIATDGVWYEPATNSSADIEAANRVMDFKLGWFTDPIYHPNGDYPASMRKLINKRSHAEQFTYSRLPKFTSEEINYIKKTYDYFALNHYGSSLVTNIDDAPIGYPSYSNDIRAKFLYDPIWNQNDAVGIRMMPDGFRKVLNWIKNRYGDMEIIITENGYSDRGGIEDYKRIEFFKHYLSALLDAIYQDKIKVIGYSVRSVLDSFEWEDGYASKSGLYQVNFSDPNRTRIPKSSVAFYKELISRKRLTSNGEKISSRSLCIIIFIFLNKLSYLYYKEL